MGTIRSGEVRFRIYPQDHEPRHAHGFIGSGQVIVDLRADGTVALASRKDCVIGATGSEVRKTLNAAADAFDEITAEWEKMHVESQSSYND